MKRLRCLFMAAVCSAPLCAHAAFTININLVDIGAGGVGNSGLSTSQVNLLNGAVTTWESLISGYQAGITLTGITIDASAPAIDGPFGIIGSAGPSGSLAVQGGYVLTQTGQMEFDSADLANLEAGGTLDELFLHEMGHVFGIGTLWNAFDQFGVGQDLYTDGTGQYTGTAALAQYNLEYDPGATFIPVELDGGSGTADGHWNEAADNPFDENVAGTDSDPGDGGPAPTVINPLSPFVGLSLDDELMTGVQSGSSYISNTTLGSLEDLGYSVNYIVVPEPSTGLLAALGLAGLCATRRRRP